MTPTFKAWSVSLLAIAAIALISVAWFDKPIALLVYEIFGARRISEAVVGSPILSIPLIATSVFVVSGLIAVAGRQFSKLETALLLCNISTLATDAIKNQLKFAFGRTWPDSWAPGIQSLIRDNAYGFHFFQSGQSFESFPSGHAAVAAAVMSVLWILYPRLRAVCAICIVAVDLGLVALNLHFLSDVAAGSFVGVSTGLFTVALWRGSSRHCGFVGRAAANAGQPD